MKKSKFSVVALIWLLLAGGLILVSCASTSPTPITGENPFLGTWDGGRHGGRHVMITFNTDGTGEQTGTKFTYTVDGNTAQVTIRKATATAIINGDTLIFMGVSFKKQ
jgi:hypothetical protein